MSAPLQSSKFQVGQLWNYNTRPQDGGSQLIIVKIDELETGRLIHISLSGIQPKLPADKGNFFAGWKKPKNSGFSGIIAHMPFDEQAIETSVTTLAQAEVPLNGYEEGYNQWKAAFDRGQAGVFTIPVAEAVEFIVSAMP